MGTLYRALWSDATELDRRGIVELARDCFTRWALDDEAASSLPDGETVSGPRHIAIRTVEDADNYGIEGVRWDDPPPADDHHTIWSTRMRVVATADRIHFWVENDMESDDLTQRVKVGRPRLVDDLLALPGRPSLGGSALLTEAVDISSGEAPVLMELLRNPERTLPVIVFTAPAGHEDDQWAARAERTARRAGGVATVVRLDAAATAVLGKALGPLAVWGGAIRTYAPAPLDTEADGWRHRYIPAARVHDSGTVVDRLVYAVTQLSTRRRVPEAFTVFDSGPAGAISAVDVARLEESWSFELELEQEERSEVERELAKTSGHLARLTAALRQRGLDELIWETHDPASDDAAPDSVQDVSEAILAAQMHLSGSVALPESAAQELDGIDAASNAYAWGNTTWRGFRALAAYTDARRRGFTGNFWAWCERGDPMAWPASAKKLAMSESESVQNNARFMQARLFEVDSRVAPSGEIHMESHLKISEGGGDLAPRVYFHDDTGGITGLVHIGFVGPHYLTPNTKS